MTDALQFEQGDSFATVSLTKTVNGYTSVWWISIRSGMYIRLISKMSLPVFGATLAEARNSVEKISFDLIDTIVRSWGGESGPSIGTSAESHAKLHMMVHGRHLGHLNDLEKTVAFYELLSGFEIRNPSHLIAEEMGIASVRTVQDRIARARDDGLLERYGRGRSHVKI